MSRHGTLLLYDARHRLAVIGWESGDVSSLTISEHLQPHEINMLLSLCDTPIKVKHGTHVSALLPGAGEGSGMTATALFETFELQQYAYHTLDGSRVTLWCGMAPTSKQWYVREGRR